MTNNRPAIEEDPMEIDLPEGDLPGRRDRPLLGKRPYESPCLIEWGSLTALTRGPISGLDDLPLDGGTTVE